MGAAAALAGGALVTMFDDHQWVGYLVLIVGALMFLYGFWVFGLERGWWYRWKRLSEEERFNVWAEIERLKVKKHTIEQDKNTPYLIKKWSANWVQGKITRLERRMERYTPSSSKR